MIKFNSVAQVGLTVRNLRISEQWYSNVLDFERIAFEQKEHSDSVVLFHRSSGLELTLRHYHASATARFDETRTGLDRLSFAVESRDSLKEWEQHFASLRVVHSEIADEDGGSVLVFRDPDHIQLEMSWRSEALITSVVTDAKLSPQSA